MKIARKLIGPIVVLGTLFVIAWFGMRIVMNRRAIGEPFRVIVNTGDSPRVNIELADEFLKFQALPIPTDQVFGFLFIPAKSINDFITLKFTVVNDLNVVSQPLSLQVELPRGVEFECPGLTNSSPEHSARFTIDPLPARTGRNVEDIRLRNVGELMSRKALCTIRLVSEEGVKVLRSFWIVLVPTDPRGMEPMLGYCPTGDVPFSLKDERPIP